MTDKAPSRLQKLDAVLDLFNEHLQVFHLFLIGFGLAMSCVFLFIGLITGDNWTLLCSALPASGTIGGGLAAIGRGRSPRGSGRDEEIE